MQNKSKLTQEQNINTEDIVEHKYYEGYIKNSDGEIETVTLESVTTRSQINEEDFISQAKPVRIPARRTKPVKRDHKRILVFGDEQIGYRDINGELVPTHDEGALSAVRALARAIQPDVIVGVGDTVDMPNLSRFSPDSDHFTNKTFQESLNRLHQWDAELRADNPDADIVRLTGNHNRLTKFVIDKAMALYGLKRANTDVPVLTLPFLVRAEENDIQYITGYPANEYRYDEDLVFVHGNKVNSSGSTAARMTKDYPDRNVVFGHIHKAERHTTTNYLGKYLTAITFGTLSRIDGFIPSFGNGVDDNNEVVPQYENWQQACGIIDDYGDGNYQFTTVFIRDGSLQYEGKEYN